MDKTTKTEITPCPDCGEISRKYLLKLIPSGRGYPFPKYIPQIKELCLECGHYYKFVTQSPELITAFNSQEFTVEEGDI